MLRSFRPFAAGALAAVVRRWGLRRRCIRFAAWRIPASYVAAAERSGWRMDSVAGAERFAMRLAALCGVSALRSGAACRGGRPVRCGGGGAAVRRSGGPAGDAGTAGQRVSGTAGQRGSRSADRRSGGGSGAIDALPEAGSDEKAPERRGSGALRSISVADYFWLSAA